MRPVRLGVAVGALALVLSACGSKGNSSTNSTSNPPATNSSTSSTPAPTASDTTPTTSLSSTSTPASGTAALNACMVLDTGGIDDKSFNQSSYAGLTAAKQANPNLKISYVPSNSGNDYTPNLTAEVNKGCDPVLAVGGLMETNVKAIAKANPKVHFAEVDAPSQGPNSYGLQFNTAQGAFLGGYLAAGMTKTGAVGTWGGVNIAPVTIYMDGFWEGVQYYNAQNHKSVKVLGWDETKPKQGVFSNSFTDTNKGKQISDSLVQQGADIIFPVAGGAGQGAVTTAKASSGKVLVIWVDVDGCVSLPQDCSTFLTSVTKNLTGSVETYMGQASSGTFPTGSYVGTLANGGTGLAPYHDFASKVPAALTAQIAKVKADIVSGAITLKSTAQPTS